MYFNVPIEARAALDSEQPIKRQLDDPIGDFFTSLFGIDPPTSTGRSSTSSQTRTRTSTEDTSTSRTARPSNTRESATETYTPPPVEETFTTRTVTSTPAANTGNSNAANQPTGQSGLSSVVIGVIVAASVIFGLIFLALAARKFFQRRRRNRRGTWGASIAPFEPPLTEKALPPAPSMTNPSGAFTQNFPSTYPAYPPAAMGFKNPQPVPYSPAAPSSAGYTAPYSFGGKPPTGNNAAFNAASYSQADLSGPSPVVLTRTLATTQQLAVVKRTYVPSLPDELSISNGETIRVLSMYDDGWAMCEKLTGGEKGVVPQECLEQMSASNTNLPSQQLAVADNTRLQRNSSLRSSEAGRY